MHNLVIDIGNTLKKVAVFKQAELVFFERTTSLTQPFLTKLIDEFKITNAIVASVASETEELVAFLSQLVKTIVFSTEINIGITNNYQSITTLGLDRWAKVIAAHRLYGGKNCLMIDAGTCITYDLLTHKSVYNGGSISPGIQMRFKALNHYTGRLPLVEFNVEDEVVPAGDNTINAIKSGVLNGIINEIIGFIAAENKINDQLKVILTGGDAVFLSKQLKNSIFASQISVEPYLVLKGLNEVIT